MDTKDLNIQDSLTLGALAHPTRFVMLEALMREDMTLTDLGRLLDEKPGKLRFHLMKLVKAGLAELVDVSIVGGFVEKRYRATMNRVVSEADSPTVDTNLADKRSLAIMMVEVLTRQFRERLLRDPGGLTYFGSQTITLSPAQRDEFFHDYVSVLETYLLPHWHGYTGGDAIALDLVTLISTNPNGGGVVHESDSPYK